MCNIYIYIYIFIQLFKYLYKYYPQTIKDIMNPPCTTCNSSYEVCPHLNEGLCINCVAKANKVPHNFYVTFSNYCMYCCLEGTFEFLADDFIDASDASATFNTIYNVYEIGYADGQDHKNITINKDKIDKWFIRLLHFYEAGYKAGQNAMKLENMVKEIGQHVEEVDKMCSIINEKKAQKLKNVEK